MAAHIVFERLDDKNEDRVRLALRSGATCRFLFPESLPIGDPRWQPHISSGKLQPLVVDDPLYVNNDAAAAPALAAAERHYPSLSSQAFSIRFIHSLYGSQKLDDAFKKQLASDLWRAMRLETMLKQIDSALPEGEVRLVPDAPLDAALWESYASWIGAGATRARVDSDSLRTGKRLLRARTRRAALLSMYVAAGAAAAALKSLWSPPRRLRRRYGVAIVSPAREFANPHRGPEMILDGENLTRENTLFIPLEPLTTAQKSELGRRGLTTAYPREALSPAAAIPIIRAAVSLAGLILARRDWASPAAAALLKEYWIWTGFLEHNSIESFLTYADIHLRHIGRAVLFARSRIRTCLYLDTENLGALNHVKPGREPNLHPYWTYLTYDLCLTWSERLIEYYRRHRQAIGRYEAVGVVWGDAILNLRRASEPGRLAERFASPKSAAGLKIVCVFDSTYNDLSRTTYGDGTDFALAVERLIEGFPEAFFLWKEKKPRGYHPESAREFIAVYDRLAEHPRCRMLDSNSPSEEVLASADFCLCFPFTSSGIELISAGGRAAYFVPNEKYFGSFFETIPGLVARSHEELAAITRSALSADSHPASLSVERRKALARLDPFLDGKALVRLRRIFTSF